MSLLNLSHSVKTEKSPSSQLVFLFDHLLIKLLLFITVTDQYIKFFFKKNSLYKLGTIRN